MTVRNIYERWKSREYEYSLPCRANVVHVASEGLSGYHIVHFNITPRLKCGKLGAMRGWWLFGSDLKNAHNVVPNLIETKKGDVN